VSDAPRASAPEPGLFSSYAPLSGTWDELFEATSKLRPSLAGPLAALLTLRANELGRSQSLAERSLLNQGVTFSVYSDERGSEKIFPFCLVPRVVTAADWRHVERGLEQRIVALQHFLDDIYGDQKILASGKIPREVVLGAKHYLPQLRGVKPPQRVRIHISGIDLIRDPDGVFRVLEDNLRTPSGVSYVIENRQVTKRVLPTIFAEARVRRVDHYPARLAETLRAAPEGVDDPLCVVLTPGPFNSAYFEHSVPRAHDGPRAGAGQRSGGRGRQGLPAYDARAVGACTSSTVASTTPSSTPRRSARTACSVCRASCARGRRATSPSRTRPATGSPTTRRCARSSLTSSATTSARSLMLCDVSTLVCARDDDRRYVLEHLDQLVVKAVDEAGGYGMLMGPSSTAAERDEFRRRIEASPRSYVAQRRVELSTCPTWDGEREVLVPRRVDLRPYVLTSPDGPWVLPGGLTRVALREGSYVVNSSQGGGSKDTWVLQEET
jgi:uncharacterized circularly permuted ATP-grasp superfamily protein